MTTLFVILFEDCFFELFIIPAERVGARKLVEPDPGVQAGEVHGVTLVPDDDHVPGGARELAELRGGPLQQTECVNVSQNR